MLEAGKGSRDINASLTYSSSALEAYTEPITLQSSANYFGLGCSGRPTHLERGMSWQHDFDQHQRRDLAGNGVMDLAKEWKSQAQEPCQNGISHGRGDSDQPKLT